MFGSRKSCLQYSCCKDHSGLCYKFFFECCLCYENCFKCYVCYNNETKKTHMVCCCYNCYVNKNCLIVKDNTTINQVEPVYSGVQQRQLYAPQGMPQNGRPLNQNSVMPGNPIAVNDNRPYDQPQYLINPAYAQQQNGFEPNNQNFEIPMQKNPLMPSHDQTVQKSTYAYQENNSIPYYNPPMENVNVDNQNYQYPEMDPYVVNSNNIKLTD